MENNNSDRKLRIKIPNSTYVSLVASLLYILLMSRTLWSARDYMGNFILIFGVVAILLFVYHIVYLLISIRTVSKDIILTVNGIIVKNQLIHFDQINKIKVNGYFKPTYGIMLKNKRIIPAYLCFKFAEEIDNSEKLLFDWAKENKIEIYKNGST